MTACGLLALALTGAPASAIPGSTAATAATAPARPSGTGADVILVLDNSASMRRADPRGLMRAAATDFARSLGSAAQLGVVIFDQRADLAVPLTPVGDGVATPAVDAALRRLTYGGRRTDIPAGVERALYALRTTGRQGVQRAIVVFTDGVVDLGDASRNVSQARWLREDLAAEARALEIPVFGIAFTDAADFELVQSLARSTGGGYFRVTSADGIADTFAQVHARIAELASRWIAENAAPPPAAGFAVDTATLLAAGGIFGVLIALFVRIGRRRPGEAAMPAATLRMVDADGAEQVHALRAPVTRIGRAKDNDVVLTSDTISAHHALIEWHGGSFHLKDLGSTNGTRRNGKLVSDRERREPRSIRLRHRDRLAFDRTGFDFVITGAADVDETRVGAATTSGGATLIRLEPATSPAPAPDHSDTGASHAMPVAPPAKCLIHESWEAVGACSECARAWCEWCLTERDGKPVCRGCAEKAA